MSTIISTIDDNQTLIINKEMLDKVGLSINDEVSITIQDSKIIIEKSSSKNNDIYELFVEYEEDEMMEILVLDEEVVGKEIW